MMMEETYYTDEEMMSDLDELYTVFSPKYNSAVELELGYEVYGSEETINEHLKGESKMSRTFKSYSFEDEKRIRIEKRMIKNRRKFFKTNRGSDLLNELGANLKFAA